MYRVISLKDRQVYALKKVNLEVLSDKEYELAYQETANLFKL